MKKISIFAVALGLLVVVAAQPAFAVCSNARLMTSGYIYTPGTVYENPGRALSGTPTPHDLPEPRPFADD